MSLRDIIRAAVPGTPSQGRPVRVIGPGADDPAARPDLTAPHRGPDAPLADTGGAGPVISPTHPAAPQETETARSATPLPTAIPLTPEAAARITTLEALIPRLTTPRCTLRAPRLSDFDALHAITAADREGFMGGPTSPEESWSEFCAMTATWLLRGHGMWTVEVAGAHGVKPSGEHGVVPSGAHDKIEPSGAHGDVEPSSGAHDKAEPQGEHGRVEPQGENGEQVAGFVLIGTEPGDVEHELGWLFLEAHRGRGLATEAAIAARDHAWSALRLPSLVSYVARGNDASDRLAARLGATPDGLAYDGQVTIWRHPRPDPGPEDAA